MIATAHRIDVAFGAERREATARDDVDATVNTEALAFALVAVRVNRSQDFRCRRRQLSPLHDREYRVQAVTLSAARVSRSEGADGLTKLIESADAQR